MTSIVVAMIIVLGLAVLIFGLAVVGRQGRLQRLAPKLAQQLSRAADRLNGESRAAEPADPPQPQHRPRVDHHS